MFLNGNVVCFVNIWTCIKRVMDLLPILGMNMNQDMLTMFYLTEKSQAIWLMAAAGNKPTEITEVNIPVLSCQPAAYAPPVPIDLWDSQKPSASWGMSSVLSSPGSLMYVVYILCLLAQSPCLLRIIVVLQVVCFQPDCKKDKNTRSSRSLTFTPSLCMTISGEF